MGKANGLRLLLDAQTFDYTFHKSASEGFKIAVQHHLDQPLMSVKELDIATGFETQIAVTPVIYNTTQAALQRFSPQERGCYAEDEMTFKYLPKSLYRFEFVFLFDFCTGYISNFSGTTSVIASSRPPTKKFWRNATAPLTFIGPASKSIRTFVEAPRSSA